MARKRKGRAINGILLVDKPQGMSSNHVVQHIKRLYKAAKAGHTGALDPLATGLLPVCLGEATKFSQFLLDADKTYIVNAKLGQRTDTSDADGEVVETKDVTVSTQEIRDALVPFTGKIKQVPSMFSALKHQGKPLYYYARQGVTIEREAREITIHAINWLGLKNDELSMEVSCSKGTYIRTLVDDLGQVLGCGAHVSMLRRTQVAHYEGKEMHTFDKLNVLKSEESENIASTTDNLDTENEASDFSELDKLLLPMDTAITSMRALRLEPDDIDFLQHGGFVDVSKYDMNGQQVIGDLYRIYDKNTEQFAGIAIINKDLFLQPKRLVVYQDDISSVIS